MGTIQGLLFIIAIFALGVAVLAILFFGREKVRTFSRFTNKPGPGGKLPYLVIGMVGLAVVLVSLTGLVPVFPTVAIGAALAWLGLGMLMPDQTTDGSSPPARGYLIAAWIKLVLALGCFGGAGFVFSQINDGYGWLLFSIPLFGLFYGGCVLAGNALLGYLRYVERKPLPDVEPEPAVLAELLKTGPVDPSKVRVAAPVTHAEPLPPPGAALPGLLVGVVCLSAGILLRTTELVSTEIGYVVGVPLFFYGIIRCGLSLLSIARSLAARRI